MMKSCELFFAFPERNIKKYFIYLMLVLGACLIASSVSSQTQKSNLPTVYVYTDNGAEVTSTEQYLSGRIQIISNDASESLDASTRIRGRGNSTWKLAKKPYRIKLAEKYKIFNLPAKAKSWTLLANHADKTLIRNALAFKISTFLGMEFTPSVKFVDFVLNDTFLGNYMLSDQVEVNSKRVNIDELDSTVVAGDNLTGGYLLEIDGFAASEPIWFTTNKGLKITVKSPDEDVINFQQLNYIQNYIADFENRLFSADFKDPDLGYRTMVDSTSLVNWYIGCELTGNPDSFWSTYIYKKRNDNKLYFGPMWDYDIAFNNDNRLGDAVDKLMRNHAHEPRTWITQLYQDEWFQQAVWRRWNEIVNNNMEVELTNYITQTAALIDNSQQLNFSSALWPVLSSRVYREEFLFLSYSEGVDYLKQYVRDRIAFLNTALKYTEMEKPSEIFVADANYYYMILNKKTNNVIAVKDSSLTENAPLVSGTPIEAESSQMWNIQDVGNDTYLLINKKSGLVATGNGHNSQLTQKTFNPTDSKQRWKIVPVNTGNVYALQNVATGYTINNSGGKYTNGNPIIEYTSGLVASSTGYSLLSENQQWYLQKQSPMTSSIIEYGHSMTFKAAYNASTLKFEISYQLSKEADISITIFNIFGQRVADFFQKSNAFGDVELSAPGCKQGVYLICLRTNTGNVMTKKIIINK